jgi:cytoskeletal protein CcmA (bactofilin family)
MFGAIKKVPTKCPLCGFEQLEPPGLISTYCRGCGDHYSVAEPLPTQPPRHARSPLHELRAKLQARHQRHIICHECGNEHVVLPHSPATICPSCGTQIDLQDVHIRTHTTRIVHTRGSVHVEAEGFLNATSVTCANGYVEGRIAGKVTCSGTLRLRGSGLCRAQITTKHLIIDRGANLRFASPIFADEIVVRGFIEAEIRCGGTLRIGRFGGLEGDVQTRAMAVDKGGHYLGDVEVSMSISLPDISPIEEEPIRVLPGWQTRLAFG